MKEVVQQLLWGTVCTYCHRHRVAVDVNVVKVHRVENLRHWRSYAANRAEIREHNRKLPTGEPVRRHLSLGLEFAELDAQANEVFLWHGLPAANVPMVANCGLDERIANCKGLYGAGIYLTDEWCKALQYTRAAHCSIRYKQCGEKWRCSCKGPKRVLLCRAVMGEPYYVTVNDQLRGERRPPERPRAGLGVVYDSVISLPGIANYGKQAHSEFVLFDRKSVYPEWIIELDW